MLSMDGEVADGSLQLVQSAFVVLELRTISTAGPMSPIL